MTPTKARTAVQMSLFRQLTEPTSARAQRIHRARLLRLKAKAKKMGWTMPDFAKALGISDRHLHRYVKGQSPISGAVALVLGSVKRVTRHRLELRA